MSKRKSGLSDVIKIMQNHNRNSALRERNRIAREEYYARREHRREMAKIAQEKRDYAKKKLELLEEQKELQKSIKETKGRIYECNRVLHTLGKEINDKLIYDICILSHDISSIDISIIDAITYKNLYYSVKEKTEAKINEINSNPLKKELYKEWCDIYDIIFYINELNEIVSWDDFNEATLFIEAIDNFKNKYPDFFSQTDGPEAEIDAIQEKLQSLCHKFISQINSIRYLYEKLISSPCTETTSVTQNPESAQYYRRRRRRNLLDSESSPTIPDKEAVIEIQDDTSPTIPCVPLSNAVRTETQDDVLPDVPEQEAMPELSDGALPDVLEKGTMPEMSDDALPAVPEKETIPEMLNDALPAISDKEVTQKKPEMVYYKIFGWSKIKLISTIYGKEFDVIKDIVAREPLPISTFDEDEFSKPYAELEKLIYSKEYSWSLLQSCFDSMYHFSNKYQRKDVKLLREKKQKEENEGCLGCLTFLLVIFSIGAIANLLRGEFWVFVGGLIILAILGLIYIGMKESAGEVR